MLVILLEHHRTISYFTGIRDNDVRQLGGHCARCCLAPIIVFSTVISIQGGYNMPAVSNPQLPLHYVLAMSAFQQQNNPPLQMASNMSAVSAAFIHTRHVLLISCCLFPVRCLRFLHYLLSWGVLWGYSTVSGLAESHDQPTYTHGRLISSQRWMYCWLTG